jgi:hypothetical protein
MGDTSRTVQRLQLRAGSRAAVRRAVPLIEDALRTASLPDGGARLVFVKRLNLGRLPDGASAQTLSLLLESRFTEADWQVVPVREADRHARAVWFRDALEAHQLAALRIADGRPVDAWFWPLAVPALATATSPEDRIRGIAFSLAAREEAAAALPAWVDSLVGAGHRERLIAALRPGDGRALLQAAGVRHVTPAPRSNSESGTLTGPVSGAQAEDRPRATRTPRLPESLSTEYDRVEFVEQMLRLTQRHSLRESTAARPIERNAVDPGSVAAVAGLPVPIRTVARAEVLDPRGSSDSPLTHAPDTRSAPENDNPAASRGERPGPADDGRASLPIRGPRASEPSTPHDARSNGGAIEPATSAWALPAAAPTTAGGLLFLLPLLERLGFAEWCGTRPAGDPPSAAVVRQIFHLLLTRLRIEEDDPAWELALNFRLKPDATHEGPGGFRLQAEETTARGWLTSCRRLLRRRARIGPATLVVRPARLAVTDTHVDVIFRLSAADVRIRGAGLDIDPGWIPWFARVVTFHYQDWP